MRNADKIEEYFSQQKTIVCEICELKNFGFIVKVFDLHAFLPFKLMPWQYNTEYWKTIFPTLKNKLFLCKISNIERIDNLLLISVNAKKHILSEKEIIKDVLYKGIVVKSSEINLIVDIGLNFDWEAGHIIGTIDKKQIPEETELNVGDFINVYLDYIGQNQLFFFEENFYQKNKSLINLIGQKFILNNDDFCKEKNMFKKGDYYAKIVDNSYQITELPENQNIECEIIDIGISFNWKYGH
ncbi:MAG: hypothetical protein LBV69_10990 [Bacteroidales bacterium]|nr:hypothetical protein [Bacteroidales bacterium]